MFDALKETIIGPDPCPWPWPKKPLDTKDILIMALLYIMILILTKGVATGTAFAMASKKYGIAEGESEEFNKTIKDYAYPAIYRIDRIRRFTISDERFRVVYENRFEEGEYRKRVQFMWPGKLQKVKFYVQEKSLEAVLDRLPTAKVIKQDAKGYLVTAEAFGEGIHMWLRSQGEWVEVIK